jgi:hypothetical protein
LIVDAPEAGTDAVGASADALGLAGQENGPTDPADDSESRRKS